MQLAQCKNYKHKAGRISVCWDETKNNGSETTNEKHEWFIEACLRIMHTVNGKQIL